MEPSNKHFQQIKKTIERTWVQTGVTYRIAPKFGEMIPKICLVEKTSAAWVFI